MTYTLKPQDLDAVTMPEVAFGTTKLLPEYGQIPDYEDRKVFERYVSAMFFGSALPAVQLCLREEFEGKGEALNKALRAHLTSWEPKHEHKIEGVAYMLSLATFINKEAGCAE